MNSLELESITRSLAAVNLFESLDSGHIMEIAKLGTHRRYRRNEYLIEQSSLGNEFFVILSGRVSIQITGADRENIEVTSLKDGDIIGETILLGKIRRVASVEAKDDVICMCWRAESLLRYFEENTDFGYQFMKNLSRILSEKISNTNMQLRNNLVA